MTLILDTDVVVNLGLCGLLETLYSTLNLAKQNFLISEECIKVLEGKTSGGKRLRSTYGDLELNRILAVAKSFAIVSQVDQEVFVSLTEADTEYIDSGEMELLSALSCYDKAVFVTAETRMLEAIHLHIDDETCLAKLRGKVVSFEQLLLRIHETADLSKRVDSISKVKECHHSVKKMVSKGAATTPQDIEDSLCQDIWNKMTICPGLLHSLYLQRARTKFKPSG